MRVVCLALLALTIAGCGQRAEPPIRQEAERIPSAPPFASAQPTDGEVLWAKVMAEPTLRGALNLIAPAFRGRPGKGDLAAGLFNEWARLHGIDRGELAQLPETSIAKFQKNPAAESGKRLCNWGTIVETVDRGDWHVATLVVGQEGVNLANTFGSERPPADKSRAHFCGVTMGWIGWPSAANPVEGVRTVGVFDVPP